MFLEPPDRPEDHLREHADGRLIYRWTTVIDALAERIRDFPKKLASLVLKKSGESDDLQSQGRRNDHSSSPQYHQFGRSHYLGTCSNSDSLRR